jgi:hypothetical protein
MTEPAPIIAQRFGPQGVAALGIAVVAESAAAVLPTICRRRPAGSAGFEE